MRTTNLALLLLAFMCTPVQAAENRHWQLAVEFDQLAVDAEKAISEVVDITIRRMPDLAAQRAELVMQLREFCARPQVVEERVRKHMSQFSEAELEQIIPVLRSPGYQMLENKRFEARNPFFQALTAFRPILSSTEVPAR